MRILFALLAGMMLGPLQAQTTLRLAGSNTVKALLEPQMTQIEGDAGCRLQLAGIGSVAGLAGLVGGATDIAMLSMPLADAVDAVNRKTPGRAKRDELRAETIGEIRTVFIINPRNPVRTLSAAQLADVLTGRVANWKDVGGEDTPVMVVSLGNGGQFLDKLLGGQPMASTARIVTTATQIAVLVAEQRAAIGIISASHPRGQTTVLQTEAKIVAPLLLVTKGPPDETVRRLFAAVHARVTAPAGE